MVSLPINLNFIVLVHDMLNYVKMRKTSIKSQLIYREEETKLNHHFGNMTIDDQISAVQFDDKENCSFMSNSISKEEFLQTQPEMIPETKLIITRLKKIDNIFNVTNFLSKMDTAMNSK